MAVEMPDEEVFGTYFLRTNVKTLDEKGGVREIEYLMEGTRHGNTTARPMVALLAKNLIREIECTNRQLKTDLRSALGTLRSSKNLRPIYHQKDSRSEAHRLGVGNAFCSVFNISSNLHISTLLLN